MVKLHLKDRNRDSFTGRACLRYTPIGGEARTQHYEIQYGSPANEQFYSSESLYEALSGFFYVFEAKNILRQAKDEKLEERIKYVEPL